MVAALAVILTLTFVVFRALSRRRAVRRGPAWDGGLRHLWSGITYTATGFSNPVRVIFEAILQPAAGEDSVEAVAQHFRTAIRRNHEDIHIVDRLVLDPSIASMRRLANVARKMHVGHVNAYAAYVLLAMLVVLIIGVGIFLALPKTDSVTM
jgi:hydrogenase-4 component B